MRLRFDGDLPHQARAVAAVLDTMQGQGRVSTHEALLREGIVANALSLDRVALLRDMRYVQQVAGLSVDEDIASFETSTTSGTPPPNLSVEMETGTGKTYTYLRTALELARRHGLRKYVVVVPGVAIREGVMKTLQLTRDHLTALYPDVPYRFFAYDAARIGLVAAFARSACVEFMVVTVDAFNKSKNVMRQPHDRFGGMTPLERLAATRPIIVLDEPHNFESALRRESLAMLQPLLVLRYGATHRKRYSLVHRLCAREAQTSELVKRVEILEVNTSGLTDTAAASARLRATIDAHLRRQAALRPLGIKVLSLVFIDRVDAYVGEDAWIPRAFDRHFAELAKLDGGMAALEPSRVRAAYFAQRRVRGASVPIDSRTGTTLADEQAYHLIMRDKERLLSLEEPVAFIFSHSALREGWDNPNVFQICTLGRARSSIRKRQEIGRGIRLCVDGAGRRVHDPEINVLRVIAHESYEDYVSSLRHELADEPPDARPLLPGPARPKGDVVASGGTRHREPVRVLPPAWFEDTLARARQRLSTLETTPTPRLSAASELPPLVDRIAARLERPGRAIPIRRATIVALIEQVQAREHLVAHPERVADAIACALLETLAR